MIAERVLIVEDEAPIRDGLVALFDSQGYRTESAADGAIALERLVNTTYDLVVLDLMVPHVPGLEVLRRIRAQRVPTAVLVVTARGTEDDIVAGLEAGADDYVVKPFGVRELVARARGLLKRAPMVGDAARVHHIGDVTLDLDALEIRWETHVLRISARESSLLEHLLRNAQRVVSREELLVNVWGYRDGNVRTRTVDVHVQQLRAKLRDVPGADGWVATARGAGYRFMAGPTMTR